MLLEFAIFMQAGDYHCMADGQSWKKCRYAVPADGGGEMATELREHGFHECYYCENPEVVLSRRHPVHPVGGTDSSSVQMAYLCGCLIGDVLSEEEVGVLEKRVDDALAGCNQCASYRPAR